MHFPQLLYLDCFVLWPNENNQFDLLTGEGLSWKRRRRQSKSELVIVLLIVEIEVNVYFEVYHASRQ